MVFIAHKFQCSVPHFIYPGAKGAKATRMMRFFLHFAYEFRFVHSRRLRRVEYDQSVTTLFQKFSFALGDILREVEGFTADNANPLLTSLQSKFSPMLSAVWYLWKSLEVQPGDVGVILKGEDAKQPVFYKFANVAEMIDGCNVYAESYDIFYDTEGAMWSTDILADGSIRCGQL
jgi:hypothetical protein